jgi:hypothetical protein
MGEPLLVGPEQCNTELDARIASARVDIIINQPVRNLFPVIIVGIVHRA